MDHTRRPVVFLLPIWGDAYISHFFERGLLTLLAPGNLPALACEHRCIMRFLTARENVDSFAKQPLFAELQKYCTIETIAIDDIIFTENASTTITLAYLRGMEASGERYCEDWFFYLVADFLFADGALAHLLPIFASDARGITNGNFQVIEEEVLPQLAAHISAGSSHLSLTPRALMKLGLAHLHPIVQSSTINQTLCHNPDANRFFWRADANTLVGHFFLRHMLAIRPERRIDTVSASCDYSFIPEFCPSENVVHLTDSDAFAVIELQPLNHERLLVEYGPWQLPPLVDQLNEWTTAEHRANARIASIYRAAEIPAALPQALEKSAGWMDQLLTKLSSNPQPHRNHPYWVSAVESARMSENAAAERLKLGLVPSAAQALLARARQLLFTLIGRMPHVYPWHPRWLECRYGLRALTELMSPPNTRLLIATRFTLPFGGWLAQRYGARVHVANLAHKKLNPTSLGSERFDALFVHIDLKNIHTIGSIMEEALPHVTPGSPVVVCIENDLYTVRNDDVLQKELIFSGRALFNGTLEHLKTQAFGGILHRLVRFAQVAIFTHVSKTKFTPATGLYAVALAPLYGLFFAFNMLYLALPPRGARRPLSTIFIHFRTDI